jgi:hypothetical protein
MAFESFDPRDTIRQNITVETDLFSNGKTQRVINCTMVSGATHQIPVYLTEEIKSGDLPPMPHISFGLLYAKSSPQDIGANTRKNIAIIDAKIAFTKMDEETQLDFGEWIATMLVDTIRNNQTSLIPGVSFVDAQTIYHIPVESGSRQVIFYIVIEIEATYYD